MSDLGQYTSLYQSLTGVPGLDSGWCVPGAPGSLADVSVMLKFSQTDLRSNRKRSYLATTAVSTQHGKIAAGPFPIDLVNVTYISPSPSGKQLALVRLPDETKKEESFVEVWADGRLVISVSLKPHGTVCTDDTFGCLEWDPTEKYIAFVAEPPKEMTHFFDLDSKKQRGDKFQFSQDWGETFTSLACPKPFVLDVDTERITPVLGLPAHLAAGQLVWAPKANNDGERDIVFVGWGNDLPLRKLGLRYCYNRPSSLYRVSLQLPLEEKKVCRCQPITPVGPRYSARSPRFNLSGSGLVFIFTEGIVTHNACAEICMIDWVHGQEPSKHKCVVPIVDRPSSREAFCGIYTHALPQRAFLDDDTILLHTQWRSTVGVVFIRLSSGEVTRVPSIKSGGSMMVLDTIPNVGTLLSCSMPNSPASVYVVSKSGLLVQDQWTLVYTPNDSLPGMGTLKNIAWDVHTVVPRDGSDDVLEAIVIAPAKAEGPLPLILVPHGGPHSAYGTSYIMSSAFLASCGYAVAHINYRGSIGFGQGPLLTLPGHIGTQDINDTEDVGLALLAHKTDKNTPRFDEGKVTLCGGSHGGYIVGCMIGRPHATLHYKACIMRNPVTDIAGMVTSTDIPDWCLVEAGVPYANDQSAVVTDPSVLSQLYKVSPIASLAKIATPTLFLIGDSDRRVPPSQGVSMFHALQEKGVPTRLLMYPKNNHALMGAEAEPDAWINVALWLEKYC